MTERVEGIKTVVACGDDRTKNTIISTKKTAPEDDPSSIVEQHRGNKQEHMV